MTYDTLQYTDAGGNIQEVAVALSNPAFAGPPGVVSLKITPRSHAAGECVINWALPPENGIAIPFKSRCIVWFNRTSANGAPNSFAGGSPAFQGRRWDNEGSASKSSVNNSITILDAWKELEKITFQITWLYTSGGTLADPTFSDFNWPDVVLFQPAPNHAPYNPLPINGQYITTWQQIQDTIAYVLGFMTGPDAVQLQLGALEFTPTYCQWYPVRSQKCAEVLKFCLRPHPGVFTEIDYTTTPPTLHFRNVTTLTPVTLPYKSTLPDGTVHLASEIQSLDELVPDAVRIYYRINGTFNGQQTSDFGTDIYPDGAPNSLLCLDYSIDLTGSAVTETKKNFASYAFNPVSVPLWEKMLPSLRSEKFQGQIPNGGSVGALQFVSTNPYDAVSNPLGFQVTQTVNGVEVPVDYTGTYIYYTDQAVYPWFDVPGGPQVVKATVRAFFGYTKTTLVNGTPVKEVVQIHEHHFRITLTNVPTNQYFIKQTLAGEAVITGLAQSVWTELQPLQWKMRHEIIQPAADGTSLPTIIKPGKHCINLSGGSVLWNTMNAVPQEVSIQFYRTANGRLIAHHQIRTGPVDHLEPQYLTQLANMFWNRGRFGINPNQRLTGSTAGSQVDLSATDSKENSTDATPIPSISNVISLNGSGNINGQIIHDSTAIPAILGATTPTPVSGSSTQDIQTMKPRELQVCDVNGTPFFIIVHATGGYTKP